MADYWISGLEESASAQRISERSVRTINLAKGILAADLLSPPRAD